MAGATTFDSARYMVPTCLIAVVTTMSKLAKRCRVLVNRSRTLRCDEAHKQSWHEAAYNHIV